MEKMFYEKKIVPKQIIKNNIERFKTNYFYLTAYIHAKLSKLIYFGFFHLIFNGIDHNTNYKVL